MHYYEEGWKDMEENGIWHRAKSQFTWFEDRKFAKYHLNIKNKKVSLLILYNTRLKKIPGKYSNGN